MYISLANSLDHCTQGGTGDGGDTVDLVISHINVLCARVVLVVACERDGGLIVGEKCERVAKGAKNFGEEASKP